MQQPRVLITGITGFAGSHLADYCTSKAAQVVGLSRTTSRSPGGEDHGSNSVELIDLDLVDPEDVKRVLSAAQPTYIFHLAAQASVRDSWREPWATLSVNSATTWNLLDACREQCPGARIVVACSGEQYGPVDAGQLPVTESAAFSPRNPYALSKAQTDLMAGFFADAHGMHVIRARAFNHIGPGQSDTYVAASFARQVAEAEFRGESDTVTIVTGNTAPRRDFTDVRDVVRAYWLLAEQAAPGAYNVCSGASHAIAELLDVLAELTELKLENEVDPNLLRKSEVTEVRGSYAKLHEATGWQPEIELKQTMRDTLNWWRQELRGLHPRQRRL